MQTKTQKIVMASLLASLTCVATMLIKVPSPMKGYVNLGDCVVLLCGWLLSPLYGFFAAGIGSALADVFSGYIIYAPATFIIKGLMAVIACLLSRKAKKLPLFILSGLVAEVVMVLGYYVFEGFLYGFIPSLINVLPNAVQGVIGLILGVILVKVIKKKTVM